MAAMVRAKLELIAPSIGPVFSLPADFESSKVGPCLVDSLNKTKYRQIQVFA